MVLNQLRSNLRLPVASAALALLLGAVLADPAAADDGKEYPGSMCQESVDGYHVTRASGDVVIDMDGNALNVSTSASRSVSCPLVRDSGLYQDRLTYAAVSVDKPSSVGLYCAVVSRPYYGGTGWIADKWDWSPAGRVVIELPVKADTYTSGSFNLWCILPPATAGHKSGIAHYGIVEAE